MMDDSSETMDHNNASFASMELVAANKKECLPRTAVSNIKSGRLQIIEHWNPQKKLDICRQTPKIPSPNTLMLYHLIVLQ